MLKIPNQDCVMQWRWSLTVRIFFIFSFLPSDLQILVRLLFSSTKRGVYITVSPSVIRRFLFRYCYACHSTDKFKRTGTSTTWFYSNAFFTKYRLRDSYHSYTKHMARSIRNTTAIYGTVLLNHLVIFKNVPRGVLGDSDFVYEAAESWTPTQSRLLTSILQNI